MNEFLNVFNLFGIALAVLVPFIVQGIKAAYSYYNDGAPMPPKAIVVTVVIVCWFLLGLHAALFYKLLAEDAARYVLGGVLLPLSALGAYSGLKALRGA